MISLEAVSMQTKSRPSGGFGCRLASALGKLLAAASLVQTYFLALDFSRIPGYQTRFAQNRFERGIVIDQCSRYAMPHRARLPRLSTTIDVDQDVERIQVIGQYQRLAHDHAARLAGEELVDRFVIDRDFALAGPQEDPRHRALAAACSIVLLDCHEIPRR